MLSLNCYTWSLASSHILRLNCDIRNLACDILRLDCDIRSLASSHIRTMGEYIRSLACRVRDLTWCHDATALLGHEWTLCNCHVWNLTSCHTRGLTDNVSSLRWRRIMNTSLLRDRGFGLLRGCAFGHASLAAVLIIAAKAHAAHADTHDQCDREDTAKQDADNDDDDNECGIVRFVTVFPSPSVVTAARIPNIIICFTASTMVALGTTGVTVTPVFWIEPFGQTWNFAPISLFRLDAVSLSPVQDVVLDNN
eukprot:867821_1